MMNYKYNEHKYAELINQNGFLTKHIPTELKLLAIYYRDILELKPKERLEKMYLFCQKHIPDFNKAKYFKIVNRAYKQSLKTENKLITINSIPIYEDEVNYINSLNLSIDHKKVLFALLVYKKLCRSVYNIRHSEDTEKKEYNMIFFNGGNKTYNNIKNISKISSKYKLNDDIIYDLSQYELERTDDNTVYLVTIMNKGLILLNYIDYIKETGNIAVEVKNFNNIGWYLDYYNHADKMKLCKYCNQPFKKSSNRQEFCSNECFDMHRKSYKTNKQKEYRNNVDN